MRRNPPDTGNFNVMDYTQNILIRQEGGADGVSGGLKNDWIDGCVAEGTSEKFKMKLKGLSFLNCNNTNKDEPPEIPTTREKNQSSPPAAYVLPTNPSPTTRGNNQSSPPTRKHGQDKVEKSRTYHPIENNSEEKRKIDRRMNSWNTFARMAKEKLDARLPEGIKLRNKPMGFTSSVKTVGLILYQNADSDGFVTLSLGRICKDTYLSERTVRDAITILKAAGILKVIKKGQPKRSITEYKVIYERCYHG